ncbi:hypothetical protein AB0B85_09335 [Micromonospora sp. NPDC049044]|uniref:hypothetical protein n=1 Tax=Micromonospora sp. NPDC049044 TaxID=3154827 RepID=UPI0033E7E866
MIAFDIERSLFAALIPPGPAHVHAVHTLALANDRLTALQAGFWASLPLDYLLRISGRADLGGMDVSMMPAAEEAHPLVAPLLVRILRLNCQTDSYASLWSGLFEVGWGDERWAVDWPNQAPLEGVGPKWVSEITPLRSEFERRAALVEIDALVAVWLNLGIEQLIAMLRARYPILTEREDSIWFDALGRKIAADPYTFGVGQVKGQYERLMKHLSAPGQTAVPDGYAAPFYKADRESEYRQAHAVFSKRLKDAIDAGWQPS